MTASENKLLLQRIFREMSIGNTRPLVESMADDFSWTIKGTTKWSKTYSGKQVVLTELFAALRARIIGRVRTVPLRFIAEGDWVVVEARGENTTRDGRPYNNSYCFLIRLVRGELRELIEYMDTQLVTETMGSPE
jgi:uncharacterized protein